MFRLGKFKDSLQKHVKGLQKTAVKAIDEITRDRLETIKKLSPTDTGNYNRSHQINKARTSGNVTEGGNYNNGTKTDPNKVEKGRRKSSVYRHKGPPRKPTTRIYRGIGAMVYKRSENIKRIQDIIKKFFT